MLFIKEMNNGNDLKFVLPPRVYCSGYASAWGFGGVVIWANSRYGLML
jgi:hypothetical protein